MHTDLGFDLEMHPCEVHRLVDHDSTVKLCRFCKMCKAWICSDCWYSPKRIKAFVAKLFEKKS